MSRLVFVAAVLAGAGAARHYARLGLTLSHYDARAHLVVARRVVDSLTPGWRQLGGVWMPLPHLLNLLPVQVDWNFRTGFSAVAISVVALASGLAALSRYLSRHAPSPAVALIVPLIVLLNPSVLYLQSTPLTEPLLFGLSFRSLLAMDTWIANGRIDAARRAGRWLAALLLTRYEGWLIAVALVTIGWFAAERSAGGRRFLLLYPAAAALGFFALSYFSTGTLLVTGGFFTPDNPARGAWMAAVREVTQDTRELAGPAVMLAAAIGALGAIGRAARTHARSCLPLALFASALLPIAAFHAGHPERVRYMVALAVAAATLSGVGFVLVPRPIRAALAFGFLAWTLAALPPLSTTPMVQEAQWEVPFSRARRDVSGYLSLHYDGAPIMASMSSLGHYMQETASIGLRLGNFLHEGNGDLWTHAWDSPRDYVHWVLVEEQATGGDSLARRARQDPSFLQGFARVAAGGGVSLYRRLP